MTTIYTNHGHTTTISTTFDKAGFIMIHTLHSTGEWRVDVELDPDRHQPTRAMLDRLLAGQMDTAPTEPAPSLQPLQPTLW